jgi:hypothetical protein
MQVSTETVYLEGNEIAVPVACQKSGRVVLAKRRSLERLGAGSADCVDYTAVARIRLSPAEVRGLERRLADGRAVGLLAKLIAGSKTVKARLDLLAEQEAETRTGATFATGWLSCGRGNNLSNPGLRLYVPGTTPSGKRTDSFGQFYNDGPSNNWAWYQPYLYEYGHGWVWTGEWRGPIYVPPYTTIGVATGGGDHLLNANQGYNAYLAGAVYIWWYDGYKDWNWVFADSPNFGYSVAADYYCHIP